MKTCKNCRCRPRSLKNVGGAWSNRRSRKRCGGPTCKTACKTRLTQMLRYTARFYSMRTRRVRTTFMQRLRLQTTAPCAFAKWAKTLGHCRYLTIFRWPCQRIKSPRLWAPVAVARQRYCKWSMAWSDPTKATLRCSGAQCHTGILSLIGAALVTRCKAPDCSLTWLPNKMSPW